MGAAVFLSTTEAHEGVEIMSCSLPYPQNLGSTYANIPRLSPENQGFWRLTED